MDWDGWRAQYGSMSYAEQQAEHAVIAGLYPAQRHYNAAAALTFLDLVHPELVVEVGGWDGELAAICLNLCPGIRRWENHELAPNLEHRPAADGRYVHRQDGWVWDLDVVGGDALVMSHVAEHMLLEQFDATLGAFTGWALYVDTPLAEDVQSWRGFTGTHVIDAGWRDLEETVLAHGFRPLPLPGFEHYRSSSPPVDAVQVRAYER